MSQTCPSCARNIEFDLAGLSSFILRLKCPGCSRNLSYSSGGDELFDLDGEAKKSQLVDLVRLALADGQISEKEGAILRARAADLGLGEHGLAAAVADEREALVGSNEPVLVEEYDEKMRDYREENGTYDWVRFAGRVACLPTGHPHLKRYRDDLVEMLSGNAERMKEAARTWERAYDNSSDSTEWEELLEHKSNCLEIASNLRQLREDVRTKEKEEFLPFVRALHSQLSRSDGW